ncbi:MAG: PatB family C-S lyase [Lagierella massiliensis]|nr:PatB family C-S lyase [Lagierella massiliensis]
MDYDFKSRISRKDTGSAKWELMYKTDEEVCEEVVPLSVADMEFHTPPCIVDGLKNFLDHGVLGYTMPYDNYLQTVKEWFLKKHNYKIQTDWIVQSPGVVNAFTAALRALCNEGEGVIIFKPIYPPMINAINSNNLKEVNVPLINNDERYEIDFETFEKACKDSNNKVLLFCSPHNPVGRIWSIEELKKVGKICLENDIIIISDEIWMDLIRPGNKHNIFASISKDLENNLITCSSPSKAFNIAGLNNSNIIVANEEIREKLKEELVKMHSTSINILGYKACECAYKEGLPWLNELLKVIDENFKLCEKTFSKLNLPYSKAEGTYVIWVNFNPLGLGDKLEDFLIEKANIFTTHGKNFGQEGIGYERFNLALPTDVLKEHLNRLVKAINDL